MRQTVLIYLHVTARLQLINCFKRRPLHELNFNTRFQLPSSLRKVKYNFNILVYLQIKHKHKSVMECTLILMPFTKETASLYAKPAKHKLHLSAQSSLTSETRHFDAQLILLRILRSSKYIKNIFKLIYVFVSAHVKIGV